jgi:hypothetical protein
MPSETALLWSTFCTVNRFYQRQCCETGTVGTAILCLSETGTGTVINYGSEAGTGTGTVMKGITKDEMTSF